MLILACCWWLGSVSGALAQKRPFVFRMAALSDREMEKLLEKQYALSFGLKGLDENLPLTIRYQKEGASEWQEKTFEPFERRRYNEYDGFLLFVPEAGNYIVEIPAESMCGFASYEDAHIAIVSWGDVIWTDCRLLSHNDSNMQEASRAGTPNLSQVKRLEFYSTFNVQIQHWDISQVEDIKLDNGIDLNLGEWKLRQCKRLSLDAHGFSTANYSASLIGWAAQEEIATGVLLDVHNMAYNSTAIAAREKLIKEKGWRISGDFLSEEEYILRFAEPKYTTWVREQPKLRLFAHGISRSAIQIINTSTGKELKYSISYENRHIYLDAFDTPGTYKIIARVPEVKGVHKALQTECEVVVKNRIPISVKIDGKEKYMLGINKEHTLKIECEDPDIRFTYRPNEWFEKDVVIKETGKNTWTFQLKRLATREGVDLDSLFQSPDTRVWYSLKLPHLKWGKEYSRSFDLALYGTPTEVALLLENAPADTKLEFGVAQGKEVVEVTPEGIVKAKAIGRAQIYAMLQGQESTKQFFNVRVWGMPKIMGKGVRTEGGKTIVAMVVGDTHSSFRLEEEYKKYFSYEWKYPPHVPAGQALSAEANGEKIELELKRGSVCINTSITVEVVPAKLPLERFELLIDGKVVKEGDTFSLSYLEVRNKDLIVRYYPYNADDGQLVSQQLTFYENEGSFLIKKPGKYPVRVQSLTHPDKVLNFSLEITAPELKSIGLKCDGKEVTGDVLEIPFLRYAYPLYISPEPRGAYGDWEVMQESGEECLGISLDMSYRYPAIQLKYKKEGSSTIVIRSKDNKKISRSLTIKLIPETLAVELQKGEKKTYKMRYFSDTPTITIAPEGIVKATYHREYLELEALGEVGQKATVTLQYEKGRLVYEVSIKDAARQLRGIAFNPWYLGLRPGESAPCSLSFDPPTADVKEVTFEYSRDGLEYLRYENGILHVSADIPFWYVYDYLSIVAKSPLGFETKLRVEVLPPELFEVKLLKEGEGRLSIEGHHDQMLNTIVKGTELTVKAEASEGYTLTALMAGGKDILATKKFTVTSATEVKAVFVKKANSDDNQDNNKPPLALEDATLATIAVSPNPFSSQLRIINSEGIRGRYEFVSSTGVLLRSGVLEGKESVLETAGLPAGIYLVRIYGDNAMQKSVRVLKY